MDSATTAAENATELVVDDSRAFFRSLRPAA
jgi:hypothetical protein